MPGPYGPPPNWNRGEPLTASKLNDANSRPVLNIRVGAGLQATRVGQDVSIILNDQSTPWPMIRAKLTTAPLDSTPYVAGCTPWDGTALSSVEVFCKLTYPHSTNDDLIMFMPFGGTDQTDPNGSPVLWLEDDKDPDVLVRIDSNSTGGGKYVGTIYGGVMTDSGSGNFAPPDGLTAGQECLVLNLDEQATPTHWLLADGTAYAEGVYWGMSDETNPVPIVVITRGKCRTASPQALAAGTGTAANTDQWQRDVETSGNFFGDTPVSFQVSGRTVYDPTTLTEWFYYRVQTLATDGRTHSVGPEIRVQVFVAESCTT